MGGGGPPVNIFGCFQQGLGFALRRFLWLFRVCGGFVYPFRWFAFGPGRARWFRFFSFVWRLSLAVVSFATNLDSVWCWFFWFSLSRLCLGFGRVRRFRFLLSPAGVGRAMQKVGNLRCILLAFR